MSPPIPRPRSAALAAMLAIALGASAQTSPPTLAEAVEAAWRLSPQSRSLAARQSELSARTRAASSFFAGPASVSVAHQAGQGGARGARETEAEILAPLWSPRLKSATASQVDADRVALDAQIVTARLALAREARELSAEVALARAQIELSDRKLIEARALADDTERRVKAGESARIDALRAQGASREAEASKAGAETALARSLASWRALTGLEAAAALDEHPAPEGAHPLVASAEAQVRAARSKLEVAGADRRDPIEAGVGVVREKAGPGAGVESSLRFTIRVPLGGDVRNGARIAAAKAELDASEAELDAARRQVASDRVAAIAGWSAAKRAEALAAERERFAREAQELVAKSHRLGEADLPTRLRADAERFDAELARVRASIEARRALSKLNQAYGAAP